MVASSPIAIRASQLRLTLLFPTLCDQPSAKATHALPPFWSAVSFSALICRSTQIRLIWRRDRMAGKHQRRSWWARPPATSSLFAMRTQGAVRRRGAGAQLGQRGDGDAARRTAAGYPRGRRGQEASPGRVSHPAGLGNRAARGWPPWPASTTRPGSPSAVRCDCRARRAQRRAPGAARPARRRKVADRLGRLRRGTRSSLQPSARPRPARPSMSCSASLPW